MVLKYKRPDGTGGVICRPISREERLYIEECMGRDHGGPYTMIHSRPRNAAPASAATKLLRKASTP